ncbi:MAG: hypothetical protein IKQ61_12340 [Spirochaetales bacterium]|nr:hypothetical protein [Spirochaetales bacterium]MBR6061238.1 hypothetical protein [Spirochaetales bacterium]MBR6201037.1 hypothetical protein [Spirochaetales bacterium]
MKSWKQIIRLFFIITILPIMFTSCFDITQSVSLTDGRYNISVKCGFDRNMLYLADSDEESLTEELDRIEKDIQNESHNIVFNRIDTGNEVGFFLRFDCSSDEDVTSDLADFLPYRDRRGLKFPLIIGEEIGQTEVDDPLDIAVTVLSIAKYKLLIDKNVISRITSAAVIDKDSRHSVSVPFYDCGAYYMVDVPINILYGSKWTYTDVVLK